MRLPFPKTVLCELVAPEFKTLGGLDLTLHIQVIQWLEQLHLHPRTPANARRKDGIVDVYSVQAISAPPWWQCVVAVVNPETGKPIPDPDNPDTLKAMTFTPAILPPQSFVHALDEWSGNKLTNRRDGGPKPRQSWR